MAEAGGGRDRHDRGAAGQQPGQRDLRDGRPEPGGDEPEDPPERLREREVLWRLVTGPQGTLVRQIGLADSRLAHLARAIAWLRRHYDQTLRAGFAVGYGSPSQFSREYRRMFGGPPGRDALTARPAGH